MTAAPNSSLVEKVAKALHHTTQQDGALPCLWENLDRHNRRSFLDKAQAALDACEVDELKECVRLLLLSSKGQRAHDPEVLVARQRKAEALLARLEAKP